MSHEQCYFCDERHRLETHHIVPQRFGGEDIDENIVKVCPTCHSKLEDLYNKRFYDELGVKPSASSDMPPCEYCGETSTGRTAFLMARPPYTVFHCDSCAKERGLI